MDRDQTTNKSKKQYVFEEDTNNINTNESQIKNAIFGVLFTLLKDQSTSIYTCCVLVTIQFIQTLSFAFHNDLTAPMWNEKDVTDVIHDILGYFSVVYYFEQTNWDVYVAILYICIFILAFVVLDIVYVNFAFSRRKISFSWPVAILKNMLLLFTTVLFLPFVQYFVSILNCVKNKEGNYVHSYFTEVECWAATHILHSIFAVIALVGFSAISLVTSLTLFEYKNDSNNPSARITARPNFILNIYQLITVICLTFFSGIELEIIILAIILFGSTVIFYMFHFQCPYHDEVMTKMWSLFSALNLWAALMLTFSKIMENMLFEGSVIAWLVGLPFVGYIVVFNRDHRINLLLINTNKFKNQHEVINQVRYVLKLIQWQGVKRNASVLLNGYIEIHKKSCNREDCPLKQKLAKNNRFAKSLMTKDDSINEKYALFIQLLYKTYADAVVKFPKDVALRISYAFFLLEKMHSRQQALQELNIAEMNKPSFDEEFLIFRYKKIIEDEIAESKNENQNGLDLVTESTFQNHLRQFQANIEKATLLYMEFWSQLTEETPDLAKLNDIGSKISASIQTVEDNWVKLIKVNNSNANAMKLYGKFLLEIINDKEGGEDLLEKSRKLMNAQTNKKANLLDEENNHDATPTVWMSGEQENFGIISSLNLSAASLFGYSKNDVANKKVDVLMPGVYSQFHDLFIENYLNGGEGALINKNKEKLVFGKHKTEYIFPVYLSVKAVQSIIQGIQFIATFRVEKNFKSVAYVLTTPDGTIDSITPSCISILKFDQRVISQKKANIETYLPHIVSQRAHLFASSHNSRKATATIQYTYPKEFELTNDFEGTSTQLQCQLHELNFLNGKEKGGFQFRFERVLERPQSDLEADRQVKISNFMFRHDMEQPKVSFVGEYIDSGAMKMDSGMAGYNDDLLTDQIDQDSSYMRNSMRSVSDVWKVKVPPKEEEIEKVEEVKRKDFGAGIKTYKLFHGKPVDIEDDKDSNENESSDGDTSNGGNAAGNGTGAKMGSRSHKKQEEAAQAYKEEDTQEEGLGDFNNTFKSRKQLNAIVSDRAPPSTIKYLKRVANALCLALAAISIIDYIIAVNDFNIIEKKIDLLDKSNQNIAELMNIVSRARDRYLLYAGLTGFTTDDQASLIASTQASLDSAKRLTESLQEETSGLLEEHQAMLDGQVIPMTDVNGVTTYKGLIQGTQEILTRAFTLQGKTTFDQNDPDYYFISYNLLNDFYSGLKTSSNLYAVGVNKRVEDQTTSFLMILIASILTLIIAIALMYLILFKINKSREEVLTLFLDIPEKTVKSLFSKCEGFITSLQLGDEEEVFSQFDDEELDRTALDNTNNSSNYHEFIPRKKRKHFKNSGRSQKVFFFKFFFIGALVEAYFIYIFVSIDNTLGNIGEKLIEFNSTSVAEPFYSFTCNAERQTFVNSSVPVLHEDSNVVTTRNVKAMYDLDAYILLLHANHRNIHRDDYASIFNQIMMVNPCMYVTGVPVATCEAYAYQAVSQGISVASTKFFEHTRILQRCYNRIVVNLPCVIDLITTVDLPGFGGPGSQQNLRFGLMLTNEGTEQATLSNIYLKETFRELITAFKKSLSDEFSNALTIRLVVFIIFLVLVGSIYVFLWLPLVRKINNDIWRTKSMLSMIPLNVISKIKSVKIYLKKFWNDRGISEY